jgi:hypothetical protein
MTPSPILRCPGAQCDCTHPACSCAGAMAATPAPAAATPEQTCPYCCKGVQQPYKAQIIDRGWNNVQRRQYVRTRDMEFCSRECASSYQMGCEG